MLPFNGSSRLNKGLIAYFAMDDDRPSNLVADSKYGFDAWLDTQNTEDGSVTGLNGKALHFTATEYATVSGKLEEHRVYNKPWTTSFVVNHDGPFGLQTFFSNRTITSSTSPTMYIGGKTDSTSSFIDAKIDEIMFWENRVLTPFDVMGLHNDGKARIH